MSKFYILNFIVFNMFSFSLFEMLSFSLAVFGSVFLLVEVAYWINTKKKRK